MTVLMQTLLNAIKNADLSVAVRTGHRVNRPLQIVVPGELQMTKEQQALAEQAWKEWCQKD